MRTASLALLSGFFVVAAAPPKSQDCSAPSAPMPCGNGVIVNSSPPPVVIMETPSAAGPAAVSPASIVRPAQPRDPGAYINEADYPAAALREREAGTVRFTLEVGADGRVTRCMITRSSGSSILDASTCRLMRSRARFTPAMDSSGNPATSGIEQSYSWKLPAGG